MIGWTIGAVVVAFLLGSIPFGYVIGRAFYRTDLRSSGSGNIGAMNALRTLGPGGGAAVFALDAIKGFLPVFLTARAFGVAPAALVAAAAVLGHCYSPWLGWKGGKGVATSFGAMFGLSWPAGCIAVAGWFAGALLTRYSSVGSMLGSAIAPIALWLFTHSPAATAYGVLAAVFVMYTHRDNVARLRAGTEGPIRLFKRRGQGLAGKGPY